MLFFFGNDFRYLHHYQSQWKSKKSDQINVISAPTSPLMRKKASPDVCQLCNQYHEANHQQQQVHYHTTASPSCHVQYFPTSADMACAGNCSCANRRSSIRTGLSYQPTYGPHVNQLTVPSHYLLPPAAPINFAPSSRKVPMSRLRSKSLVVTEERLHQRRNSFQRQNSIDVTGSGTILEESTTSSSEDETNKSYLSVKRASLRKRLRLKTLSSRSEDTDHSQGKAMDSPPPKKTSSEESPPPRQFRVTSL